jgi:hypothetical protein
MGVDVPVDSETLLLTDFMNLKIKPTQSFRVAHMDKVCVYVFIGVIAHTYMNICVCTVFLKKQWCFMFCISVAARYLVSVLFFTVDFFNSDHSSYLKY